MPYFRLTGVKTTLFDTALTYLLVLVLPKLPMTNQNCHPVVMEALATHRKQFFRWDKNKHMI